MEDIFDTLTEEYDSWYDSEEGKPLYESEPKCLKPLVDNALLPILEIGVGTGRFATHFPNVIGIDPSVKALKRAKERGIRTIQARGENLSFKKGVFGCVLMVTTLCFVEDPVRVLK